MGKITGVEYYPNNIEFTYPGFDVEVVNRADHCFNAVTPGTTEIKIAVWEVKMQSDGSLPAMDAYGNEIYMYLGEFSLFIEVIDTSPDDTYFITSSIYDGAPVMLDLYGIGGSKTFDILPEHFKITGKYGRVYDASNVKVKVDNLGIVTE